MSDIPRARHPYGFEFWETWADALGWEPSPKRDKAFWLYKNLIQGVRIMVKFEDFIEQGDWYAEILRRHEIAKSLGLRTMLCIDWFNRADARGGYHAYTVLPHDIALAVNSILRDFQPDIMEVCNEPYYAKRNSDKITIAEYAERVASYVDGADRARFRGEIIASQSHKNWWKKHGDLVEDGWEWHVWWPHGMIEGRHSAILHTCTTTEQLIYKVLEAGWHEGKPIGWRHPIFESELSITGTRIKDFEPHAKNMAKSFTLWSKSKHLPYAYLIMGGDEGGGDWGMYTRLLDQNGEFTQACLGIMEALGVEYEEEENGNGNGTILDPQTYPGTRELYKVVTRMNELGSWMGIRKDAKIRKQMKKWHEKWRSQ